MISIILFGYYNLPFYVFSVLGSLMLLGYIEKHIIQKENNLTLLNLGFGEVNTIFTYSNIISNVTYFTIPNIPYSLYTKMRDKQTQYLKNKQTEFIVVLSVSIDYSYFKNLPELVDNYELIGTDTDIFFENQFHTKLFNKVHK